MYQLGDIFIGNFPLTQAFGGNQSYYARFNLSGHNGIDVGCPSGTVIVSAADGWVSEIGADPSGYGNYLKIVHNGFLTLYAHLNNVVVKVGDRVVTGQHIANSNNSGFSTGPHLHFAVAPCNDKGIKTEVTNGYAGYIDPNGDRCQWTIKNLTEPVIKNSEQTEDKVYNNLTWELFSDLTSYLGIESTPNDRGLMLRVAKEKIDHVKGETTQWKAKAEEYEKKYTDELNNVVALKNEISEIQKQDATYGQEALDAQHKASELEGGLRVVAEKADVPYSNENTDAVVQKVLDYMSAKKAPTESQVNSFQAVTKLLVDRGINQYLAEKGMPPIDFSKLGTEEELIKVNTFLDDALDEIIRYQATTSTTATQTARHQVTGVVNTGSAAPVASAVTLKKHPNIFVSVVTNVIAAVIERYSK